MTPKIALHTMTQGYSVTEQFKMTTVIAALARIYQNARKSFYVEAGGLVQIEQRASLCHLLTSDFTPRLPDVPPKDLCLFSVFQFGNIGIFFN